jgi:hypothetical protein
MLLNNTKKSIINHLGGFMIMPGVNPIENKTWKEMKKHPTIARKLEEGELVEEMDAGALEAGDEQLAQRDHLLSLKEPQARGLVEQTFDLALLNLWLSVEKRNRVKGVIQKQIKTMETPAPNRDRSQSRQIETGRGPVVENLTARPGAQDD